MSRVTGITVLALTLVLATAVAGCSSSQAPTPVSSPEIPAPDFQLSSLDGQDISLISLRGRPVILNFWATWCSPCRLEMPFIQELFEDGEWKEKGLVILAINIGESDSQVAKFMEDYDLSFTVLLDKDRGVAQVYNISGIPTTFFIDENGIIKDVKIGAFSNKAEIDWRLVNSIMKEES